jgi:hypothetical protein
MDLTWFDLLCLTPLSAIFLHIHISRYHSDMEILMITVRTSFYLHTSLWPIREWVPTRLCKLQKGTLDSRMPIIWIHVNQLTHCWWDNCSWYSIFDIPSYLSLLKIGPVLYSFALELIKIYVLTCYERQKKPSLTEYVLWRSNVINPNYNLYYVEQFIILNGISWVLLFKMCFNSITTHLFVANCTNQALIQRWYVILHVWWK